jgi:asparagine synthase (glutamine-hydrolysing)
VALMAESGSVKTFSIGFEDEDFNELPYARLVAQRYGTDHHEFTVRPDATEILPKLVDHYGEPYADSSALPTYYLARLTSDHVTVALNGDGGDELFGGYPRYTVLRAYEALARVPFARRMAAPAARLAGRWLPRRVLRFFGAVSRSAEESYARSVSYFLPEEKYALYSEEMRIAVGRRDSYDLLYDLFARSDAADILGRTLYVDTLTYLPCDLLVKVDIATMANSLEGRSPLLDHELVEFVARLPSGWKLHGVEGKYLFR